MGSVSQPVNLSLRAHAQMGWRKMEHKGKMRLVSSRTVGVLVVGVTSVTRERERACSFARSPPRDPPPRRKALDLPFINARRRFRCTMGGVAMR
jgi:hypothetical protein